MATRSLEIRPDSVLGVRLGMDVPRVIGLLGEPFRRSDSEAMTFLHYPTLTVAFLRGAANMVIAELDHAGATPLGIHTGMPWREANGRLGPMEFSEYDRLWWSEREPGLGFEVARPARPDEDPIEPPYVREDFEVLDPARAIVRRIYLMRKA